VNKQQLVRYITKWNDDDNRAKLQASKQHQTCMNIPNYIQSNDLMDYYIQNDMIDKSMLQHTTIDRAMNREKIKYETISKMQDIHKKIAELTKPYKNEYTLFSNKINEIAEFIHYVRTHLKCTKTLQSSILNTILINIKSILIKLDKINDETKHLKILKGFHFSIVEYLAKRDNKCSLSITPKEQINFNKNIKRYNQDKLSKNTASHIANLGIYFIFDDIYNFDVKDLDDFNHQKPFRPYRYTRTTKLQNDMFITYYSNKKTI